jgi:hypothetical protein
VCGLFEQPQMFYCSKLVSLSSERKNQLLDVICGGMASLIPVAKKHLSASLKGNGTSLRTNEDYICALKMYMFLLHWFIQLQDKANANNVAATKVTNASKSKVSTMLCCVVTVYDASPAW